VLGKAKKKKRISCPISRAPSAFPTHLGGTYLAQGHGPPPPAPRTKLCLVSPGKIHGCGPHQLLHHFRESGLVQQAGDFKAPGWGGGGGSYAVSDVARGAAAPLDLVNHLGMIKFLKIFKAAEKARLFFFFYCGFSCPSWGFVLPDTTGCGLGKPRPQPV